MARLSDFNIGDKVVQTKGTHMEDFNYPPEQYPVLTVNSLDAGIGFKESVNGKSNGCSPDRFAKLGKVAPAPKSDLGAKFDAGKLLWRPLMNGLALPLRSLAAVLSYGAQKYKEDSWQTVPEGRARYENAYLRHANDRAAGETYDTESGLPHIAHMIINLMFVMWFETQDKVITNLDKFNTPPTKK